MYDVAVIGGGIHGSGIAQAAAVNGYSVLLLEKQNIADGTSSKSSKLIHGGLRYLESGQLSLVKECLFERALLLKNAPHLVELKPFIIPIYTNTSRSALKIRAGLSLYALLNGFKQSGCFKSIKKADWNRLDGLTDENLQHIFQYWDAQTDDRRLTEAVIKSAQEYTANVKTNATLHNASYKNNHWNLDYSANGHNSAAEAKVVINAGGPWINLINNTFTPTPNTLQIDLVQGTHIIIEGEITQGIYYLEAPTDKRAVFVMPWYGSTMIGTTELTCTEAPDNVHATTGEIEYLVNTVKHYFPRYHALTTSDIKQSFAGLRVLPKKEGSLFSRSRETIIHEDEQNAPQLFSIYGGKLTAYRATSESVIQQIQHYLPNRKIRGDTKKIKLPAV